MTKLLDDALDKARRLPDEQQDALGALLLEAIEAAASAEPAQVGRRSVEPFDLADLLERITPDNLPDDRFDDAPVGAAQL